MKFPTKTTDMIINHKKVKKIYIQNFILSNRLLVHYLRNAFIIDLESISNYIKSNKLIASTATYGFTVHSSIFMDLQSITKKPYGFLVHKCYHQSMDLQSRSRTFKPNLWIYSP
jgi:hypothetical protein